MRRLPKGCMHRRSARWLETGPVKADDSNGRPTLIPPSVGLLLKSNVELEASRVVYQERPLVLPSRSQS
jgi:hypothetical protein